MEPVPLTEIRSGHSGIVERLEGEPSFQKRLADLGIVPGTPILFVRKAPFGDPIEIELRGFHLALRRDDARNIFVTV